VTFARHSFELMQPQEDGATLLAHLEAVWEKSGEMPRQLADAPTLPPSCSSLWNDFLDLHSSRSNSGFGPSRITWRDIADWQRVRGVTLEAWEIDAIREADSMWLSDFAPKPKGGEA
jgi:hypothetical protein